MQKQIYLYAVYDLNINIIEIVLNCYEGLNVLKSF